MRPLIQFPPQVTKLLPRLASDHDGEVVATVRAIGRSLQAAGYDFHTLAAAVDAPSTLSATRLPNGHSDAGFNSNGHLSSKYASQLARWCIASARGQLEPREIDFLHNLVEKGFAPTLKQSKWLQAIAARLRREEAA